MTDTLAIMVLPLKKGAQKDDYYYTKSFLKLIKHFKKAMATSLKEFPFRTYSHQNLEALEDEYDAQR